MDTYEDDIRIVPVIPIEENTGTLSEVFSLISKRDIARLFWMTDSPPKDASEFIYVMSNKKTPFIVAEGEALLGFFWIEDTFPDERCSFSGWMPFGARGLEGAGPFRAALSFLHKTMCYKNVFCLTPFESAASACERAGMKLEATIPEYYPLTRKRCLYIYRSY